MDTSDNHTENSLKTHVTLMFGYAWHWWVVI